MKTEQIIKKNVSDVCLIDFEKETFARLALELEGKAGAKVTVAIGEKLAQNGTLDSTPGGSLYYCQAELTLKEGKNRYEFPIPEHKAPWDSIAPYVCHAPAEANGEVAPFRYVSLAGYEGEAVLIRTAYTWAFDDEESSFSCSDENLNRIWEFCKYSIKATSVFGKFVDGDRERLPYEADDFINQLGWFCNSTEFGIARATIEHFLFVHPTWPTEWHLITPFLVQDYILYSGDTACLKKWYTPLKERLHPELEDSDGLIRAGNGLRDIVDWPEGERDGYEMGKVNFVPNAFFYGALLTMYQLGHEEIYRKKASIVRDSLRRIMMKNGKFVDNPDSDHTSLHTAMFAVRFGIAEISEIPELMEFISSKGMACSVYGSQFLLESCFANGMARYGLMLMTSHDIRSWNNMLEKGATITMEAWDGSFKPNQDWNHAWGAAPASVIPRCLCGIRPISPGFSEFVFEPEFAGLQQISFRQPTINGPVLMEAEGKNVRLTVPAGSKCLYCGSCLKPGVHDLVIK